MGDDLISDNKEPQLSDAQSIRDNAFVDRVRRDFLEQLWHELNGTIDGYDALGEFDRVAYIVKSNEPYFGLGDSLPFGLHAHMHVCVYSGVQLGEVWFLGNNIVSYYRPRFQCNNLGEHQTQARELREFLYGEREIYDSLPLAYRAALLCQYIHENIVTEMRYVVNYVTGYSKGFLRPKRVSIDHIVDDTGKAYCWALRVRDIRPSGDFGKELAAYLRWEPDLSDSYHREHGHSELSYFEAPAPRAPDTRSELAYAYVDKLIADGMKIGSRRGDDISWDAVAAKLVEEYGDKVRSYTGNNLRDGYRKRNQRRREGR